MEMVGFAASSPRRISPTPPAQPRRRAFLAFTAGNRRLDRAMIQRRESLSVQCAQRLYTGHECGQQEGF